MFKKLLVAMMWVVSACSVSLAQTPTLSWLEYQKLLFEKNISLQSSHWAVTASSRARDVTGATAWPTISLGASGTHSESALVSDLFSYSLSGSYTLFDAGATSARIRAASIALDSTRLDEIKNWISVRSNARLAYVDAAYYEEKVNLLTQIRERLKRNEEFMKVKFDGGQQARWVYLSAKNSRLAVDQQIIATTRRLQQARKQLALYLGQRQLDESTSLEPLPVTVNAVLPSNYEGFVSANTDVLKAEKNIESVQAQLDIDTASLWPLLTLKGSTGLSGTPAFFPSQSNWQVGLNLSLNLFDANSRGNLILQRQAQLASARLDWYGLVLENTQAILLAHNDVKDNMEHVPLAVDALNVAQERLDTSEQLYLAGLAIYLEWDQAQQTLTQTQTNLLDTRYQLNRSLAVLEKVLQVR